MRNYFLKFLFLIILFISILIGNQNLKPEVNQSNILNNNSILNNQNDDSLFNLNIFSNKNHNKNIDNNLFSLVNENTLENKIKINGLNKFVLNKNLSEVIFPEVSAQIVLVADLNSGQILWGKNSNKRWPIASLTKLITSVFVLENFNQKDKITLTEKDVNVLDSGTQSDQKLNIGETYYVLDLIKWMMLASRNEAAEGLANFWGRDNFIKGMNDLVKSWGINSTYFSDPTGLSVSNQSVPEDILKIVQKIYFTYPEILRISTFKNIYVKDLSNNKNRLIYNIIPFAGNPDFLGGKTGFIYESKQNLVSVFNFKKQPIMILVMGSDDRMKDTKIIFDWIKSNFDLVE